MSDSEEELSFESVEDTDEAKISNAADAKLEELTVANDVEPTVKEDVAKAISAEHALAASVKKADTAEASEEQKATMAEELAYNSPTAADVCNVGTKMSASRQADLDGGALHNRVEEDTNKSGWDWGSWSSWSSSVLNTAASSVGTFTSQVGEGLYQVLETVESGLLADDDADDDASQQGPATSDAHTELKDSETLTSQEMVRHGGVDETSPSDVTVVAAEAMETESSDEAAESRDGWLAGWKLPVLSDVVSKTSSVVQQTVQQTSSVSMKMIGGSIDVLEAIGRKTYDVLAEGEHGLKKTIVKSRENRPTLSQTLREAKMRSESREQEEEAFVESRKSNFGAQFDDFQGLVQLEALESVSSTSEQKVRRFMEMLPKDAAESLKAELLQIRQVFDNVQANSDDDDVSEHDFNQLVTDYFGRLNLNARVQKLLDCQSKVRQLIRSLDSASQPDCIEKKTSKEIHQLAVQSLAEMTAYAIEHWHHVGQQMLLVSLPQLSFHSIANELASVSKVLCTEVSLQTTAFVSCLTAKTDDETDVSASELITGVYLESSNAADYIHSGFSLLLPVLQLAVIKAHPLFSDTNE